MGESLRAIRSSVLACVGLALASGCGAAARGAPPIARPDLAASVAPERPSVSDVVTAMNGVADRVVGCLRATPGAEIAVTVTFGSTGAAISAGVDDPRPSTGPDDGARSSVLLDAVARTCVVGALLDARVPAFRRDTFFIRYPFRAR